MEKTEKIQSLEFKLQNLKSQRKEKVREIDNLDTEINWIKIQLEKLNDKKY